MTPLHAARPRRPSGFWAQRLAIALLLLAAIGEVSVRASGLLDVPLYDADPAIGYIPSASQSGAFLGRNEWQFNRLHMGAPEFTPAASAHNTLLVGDSIVLGGNPYRAQERLGPQLQAQAPIPQAVWPIAAGSWALRNEVAYLRDHDDVVRAVDRVVFVLNSGDFGEASSWACEYTHPRTRPWLALPYVFGRYVWHGGCTETPAGLQFPAGQWQPELQALLARPAFQGKRVEFFLYPDQAEAGDATLRASRLESHQAALRDVVRRTDRIHSVGRDTRWSNTFYKDGIHPTPAGMASLAGILARPQATTQLMP